MTLGMCSRSMRQFRPLLPITLLSLVFFSCTNHGQSDSMSALLAGGAAVGLSPSSAGNDQTAATPGQTGSADLESTGPGDASGAAAPAVPAVPPTADTTPPRLVRIDWRADCNTSPSGNVYCDAHPEGPVFVFDEAIDCNSVPRLSGNVIENGQTIKAFVREEAGVLSSESNSYYPHRKDQSIAVVGECSGNKVRIHPAAKRQSFGPDVTTVVLVGGIKDLAGNTTPDGEPALAGPVGDVHPQGVIDQVLGKWTAMAAAGYKNVATSANPNAVQASRFALDGQLPVGLDIAVIANLANKDNEDGRIRLYAAYPHPDESLDCALADEIRKHVTVEYILWADLQAGKPFSTAAIKNTFCEARSSARGALPDATVLDADIPNGSLVRLSLAGSLPNKARTKTLGYGSLKQLSQMGTPIPFTKTYVLWKWPENLAAPQPACKEMRATQVMTHFDTGLYLGSCTNREVRLGWDVPLKEQATEFSYDTAGFPFSARGVCLDYSGPAYWNSGDQSLDFEKNRQSCDSTMKEVPAALRPAQRTFDEGLGCAAAVYGDPNGSTYRSTGVAGVCIENPGKNNEYVIVYHTPADKAKARASCKGYWREGFPGYAHSQNSAHNPGDKIEGTTAACPSSGENEGGVSTQLPPAGQSCEGRKIEIDTTMGRWYNTPERKIPHPTKPGKYTQVKGIHTYWQNEPLIVRVKNNCQEGYYKLTFRGMNVDGPLPDFYKGFTLTLQKGNKDLAGMVLGASDSLYSNAAAVVYLDKGDSEFRLMWRNDAYKEKVYDANFHLNSVNLAFQPSYAPSEKLSRTGKEFCGMDGRFFTGTRSIWTDAANQSVSYCFPGLKSGKYEVRLTAKNHGTLPAGYTAFQVRVAGDGVQADISVPASAEKSQTGKAVLDLTNGDRPLSIVWTNNAGVTDEIRAAIEIESIQLRRVGDSERSVIAAFMSAHPGRTTLIAAMLALVGLAVFFARKRMKIA